MGQDWAALTVVQLKQQLKDRGLAVTGKKAELVSRLQEHSAQQGAATQDDEAVTINDNPADQATPASAAGTDADNKTPSKAANSRSSRGSKRKAAKPTTEPDTVAEQGTTDIVGHVVIKPDTAVGTQADKSVPKSSGHAESRQEDIPSHAQEQVQPEENVTQHATSEPVIANDTPKVLSGSATAPNPQAQSTADQVNTETEKEAEPDFEPEVPAEVAMGAQAEAVDSIGKAEAHKDSDAAVNSLDKIEAHKDADAAVCSLDKVETDKDGEADKPTVQVTEHCSALGSEVDSEMPDTEASREAVMKQSDDAAGARPLTSSSPASAAPQVRKRKHEPVPAPDSKSGRKGKQLRAGTEAQAHDVAMVEAEKSLPATPRLVAADQPVDQAEGLVKAPISPSAPVDGPPADATPVPGQPSRALRIDKFVRPFTDGAVRKLLAADQELEDFWMPTIKTHCYVIYKTEEAARTIAAATNQLLWPPDNKSRLEPKFVPYEEAVEAMAVGRGQKQPQTIVTEEPAKSARLKAPTAPPKDLSVRDREKANGSVKAPPAQPADEEKTLDDLFRRTTAAPPIYWLPLTEQEVQQKKQRQQERDAARQEASKIEPQAS